jgi:sec-independent protein translocase protein TatA
MAIVTLAAFGFGGSELLIILAIMLLLFGGSKLPSLAKGLGQSVKEFKKAANTDDEPKPEEAKKAVTPPATPPAGSN